MSSGNCVAHENNKFPTGNVEMIVRDEVRRRDQSDIRIQIINRTNPTVLIQASEKS